MQGGNEKKNRFGNENEDESDFTSVPTQLAFLTYHRHLGTLRSLVALLGAVAT